MANEHGRKYSVVWASELCNIEVAAIDREDCRSKIDRGTGVNDCDLPATPDTLPSINGHVHPWRLLALTTQLLTLSRERAPPYAVAVTFFRDPLPFPHVRTDGFHAIVNEGRSSRDSPRHRAGVWLNSARSNDQNFLGSKARAVTSECHATYVDARGTRVKSYGTRRREGGGCGSNPGARARQGDPFLTRFPLSE